MTCSPDLIEAFVDSELDAAQSVALQQHMAACAICSETYDRLRMQKDGIRAASPYYTAPPELRTSIRAKLRQLEPQSVKPAAQTPWRWLALAASLLLAVSVSWNVIQMRPRAGQSDLAELVLTDHIQSLIGTHLVDVPSSDQHTVKPWFAGKLDFSPDVRDLAAQGYPLTGGRVDYLNGRRVAALVYQRKLHIINLFIWPATSPAASERSLSRNGYNLIQWTSGPMTYWAVSDLNLAELSTLRDLYK